MKTLENLKGSLQAMSSAEMQLPSVRLQRPRVMPRKAISGLWSIMEQKQEIEASRAMSTQEIATQSKDSTASMFEVGNYRVHEKIGKGGQGDVFLGSHKETGQLVAIKMRNKRKDQNASDLLKEAAVLAALQHRHIIQLRELVENEKRIILVMEYAEKGDLGHYIARRGKLRPKIAIRIFKQLIRASTYVHSQSIFHRDLKPENILLDKDYNVKIGDWGFAAHWTSFKQKNRGVGSLHYVAYEVLFNQKYTGPEVDIWALGGILYTMLTGELPFKAGTDSDVYRQIKKGEWCNNKEILRTLPVPIINLLQSIFNPNPIKRATMMDINQRIKEIEALGKAGLLLSSSETTSATTSTTTTTTTLLASPSLRIQLHRPSSSEEEEEEQEEEEQAEESTTERKKKKRRHAHSARARSVPLSRLHTITEE